MEFVDWQARAEERARRKVSAAVGMLCRRCGVMRGGGDAPPTGHSRNITKVMLLDESCRPRGPFENFVKRSVFLVFKLCLNGRDLVFNFPFYLLNDVKGHLRILCLLFLKK